MTLLRPPYLVKMRYAFQDADTLYIAMPFLPGGDLRYYLTTKGAMNEETTRFYAAEMVLALEDMHKNNVVYRDLKVDNMLFDENGHIMFSDFGLAVVLEEKDDYTVRGSAGTPGYLAPEILKHEAYGMAVDRYSLGVTLYELLEKRRPYDTKRDAMQGATAKFHTNVSDECKSLIRGLLNKNPAERLGSGPDGFDEIKKHPWFASVDWEKAYRRETDAPFKPDTERANCSADFELEDQFFACADDTAPPLSDEQQELFKGFEWNTEIEKPAAAEAADGEAGESTAATAATAKVADGGDEKAAAPAEGEAKDGASASQSASPEKVALTDAGKTAQPAATEA